jgi:tetratricopeptide (TPR) repeat protein
MEALSLQIIIAGATANLRLIQQLRARARELTSGTTDLAASWLHVAEGVWQFRVDGNVLLAVRNLRKSLDILTQIGAFHIWASHSWHLATLLAYAGELDEGIQIAERGAARSKEELILQLLLVTLARLLLRRGTADDIARAEQIMRPIVDSASFPVSAFVRIPQGMLCQWRGDLVQAELYARAASFAMQPIPSYRVDAVTLEAQVLHAQDKPEEAISRCEALDTEYTTRGIAPMGTVGMFVVWAEACARLGKMAEACEIIERALKILRRNVKDAEDSALVKRYLCNVPEHARALDLAQEWNVDCADLYYLTAR